MRRMRMLKSKTTGLIAATMIMGLLAVPASADHSDKHSPEPPATATCEGVANVWEVDAPGSGQAPEKKLDDGGHRGLTFPGVDPNELPKGRHFAWELTTEGPDGDCEVTQTLTGATQGGDLAVSGWGTGFCGSSTAAPPFPSKDSASVALSNDTAVIDNNRGQITLDDGSVVNLWDIHWVSEASVLEVVLAHDAGSDEKPNGQDGTAEVQAFGGNDCATVNGAKTFDVTIVAEITTLDKGTIPRPAESQDK